MAKTAYPIPAILPLQALHKLFHEASGLMDISEYTDAEYNDELNEKLVAAGVLEKPNDSFSASFRSKPAEADMERVSGLDPRRLDQVVMFVAEKFKLKLRTSSPWLEFSTEFFATPEYLQFLNSKKYFKFLSPDEKEIVLTFLDKRYNELGIGSSSVKNYALYMWHPGTKMTRCSILSIDHKKKSASFSWFSEPEMGSIRIGTFSSMSYSHGGDILCIDFVEDDPSKKQVRANFIFVLSNILPENVKTIKGVLAANGYGVPYCAEVVLEQCGSYSEALAHVRDEKRNHVLSLEVLTRRYEISKEPVNDISSLQQYPLYQLLQELWGHYLVMYITQDGSINGSGRLQRGLCYIAQDGLVLFKFPSIANETFKATIDQQIFRGSNDIAINYLIRREGEPYDVQYRMQIGRSRSMMGRVQYLNGLYIGHMLNSIYKGEIIFLRLDGGGLMYPNDPETDKEFRFESFSEASKKIDIKPSKPISQIPKFDDKTTVGTEAMTETQLESFALWILNDKRYDH